MNEGSLSIR